LDLAWRIIIGIAAADAALFAVDLLFFSSWQISLQPEIMVGAGSLILAVLWWVYSRLRPVPRLSGLAHTGLLYIAYTSVIAPLGYLLSAANAWPLLDQKLNAADHALGFDWLAVYHWFHAEPRRLLIAQSLYNSLGPQLLVLILLFDLMGRSDRARELFFAFLISSFSVTVLGALLPAAGAFVYYDVPEAHTTPYVQQYLGLRHGVYIFDLRKLQGIVQFPSFHAALAALCCYAVRDLRWLFAPFLVLNVSIVAVTPAMGGHHFIDVIAGLGLAAAIIWLTPRFCSSAVREKRSAWRRINVPLNPVQWASLIAPYLNLPNRGVSTKLLYIKQERSDV